MVRQVMAGALDPAGCPGAAVIGPAMEAAHQAGPSVVRAQATFAQNGTIRTEFSSANGGKIDFLVATRHQADRLNA
jgi:hypothetical protein